MVKKLKDQGQQAYEKRTRIFFLLIIVLYTFLLYGNTVMNQYALDDYIIRDVHKQLDDKGAKYFAEVFVTPYTTVESGDQVVKSFGYRPVTRLFYAVEFSIVDFFDDKDREFPGISHLVNVMLYALLAVLLFFVLKRIFKNYSIWFPFIITILFVAHPAHTEVVASIKNRDEILSAIFSLLALRFILKYHDKSSLKLLIFGLISYLLAFYSKPTAFAFWLVFPLTLYFFTNMKSKKIAIVFGFVTLVMLIGSLTPFVILDWQRDFSFVDNPLYFEDNIWTILGTGILSLGFYLKLIIYPHPLLYYYGYDMIPVVNLANVWVILTILAYAAMFGIAVWKFRQKHVVSYGILFFMLTIAMYSNIAYPVPGIVGDRFLFIPSIGFSIILTWLIFTLFKAVPENKVNSQSRIFFVVIFTILILIPYSYKTVSRNADWYTGYSLYRADIDHLENSVKAHDLLGTDIMRKVERDLAQQVNVSKFIMPEIKKAIFHFNKAIEIYPEHSSSWVNLGMIYNHPRIGEHLLAKGDSAKFVRYKRDAISSFKRSLVIDPGEGKALFNLGLTYEQSRMIDSAVFYYEQCIHHNPQIINPRSRLSNLRFMQGKVNEALELNEEIMFIDPNEALPYLNYGNYYMMSGDTLKAIVAFEEAAKRNARPEVFAFLSEYFSSIGDMKKAQSFRDRYLEATKN